VSCNITVDTLHAAPRRAALGPKSGGRGAPNCQSRRRRRDHFVGDGGAARPAYGSA